jgi:hypothetical protein
MVHLYLECYGDSAAESIREVIDRRIRMPLADTRPERPTNSSPSSARAWQIQVTA